MTSQFSRKTAHCKGKKKDDILRKAVEECVNLLKYKEMWKRTDFSYKNGSAVMGLIKSGERCSQQHDGWPVESISIVIPFPPILLVVRQQRVTRTNNGYQKGCERTLSPAGSIGPAVNEGQCMIIVDQGRCRVLCHLGEFVYDSSTEPTCSTEILVRALSTFSNIGKFTFR